VRGMVLVSASPNSLVGFKISTAVRRSKVMKCAALTLGLVGVSVHSRIPLP